MTYCRACNSPLLNRRAHATTCNSACRNKAWRKSRITMLPVQLMLSIANHSFFTKAANAVGVPIDQYLYDRIIQTTEFAQ